MAETSPLYNFAASYASSSTLAAGSVEESTRSANLTSELDPALLEKKRKNASAQAAFRQRRSNYIANLEETVTSLESVVRRLQDALRDCQEEINDLRQDNVHLNATLKGFDERERIWKAYAKATAGTPAAVAASQQLAAASAAAAAAVAASSSLVETPLSSAGSLHDHSANGTTYGGEEGTVFGDETFSFGKAEDLDGEAIRGGLLQQSQQCSPLSLYSSTSSGHSTAVTTSPTPMHFTMDPTAEGQLTPSSTVDCAFGGLSSLSSFNGADGYSVDANMPPPSYPTSYNSFAGLNDFTATHRRSLTSSTLTLNDSMDYTTLDNATTTSTTTTTVALEESSAKDSSDDLASRVRRRHTYSSFPAPSSSSSRRGGSSKSRSNSNPSTGMSNTLAVIKAQAFGNVRKTRARAKKNPTSGEAAKAAVELLEARGFGLGLDLTGDAKKRGREASA